MNRLAQHLRYAFRQFRRAPGFAVVAILTLALGIAGSTAIFSLLDQVLLRRLPIREPERLVMLKFTGSDTGFTNTYGGDQFHYFSYPMYQDLRDQNQVFTGILAMFPAQVGVQWKGTPTLANSELVTGNYFSLLGVGAELGRVFVESDSATRGAAPLVVLSHRYWKERLAGDPGVLNQNLLINGKLFTIVGVARPGFNSVIGGTQPDFFVPISMKADMTPGWDFLDNRRAKWLNIIGRLKPGLTVQQAEAGINPLWKSLRASELQSISGRSQQFRQQFVEKSYLSLLDASRGFSPLRDLMRVPLLILMGMVALLTIMATANVASLLLVRSAGRIREMSVRYALGATRRTVTLQLLVEGLTLGLVAGAAGAAFSPLLASFLIGFVNPAASAAGVTSLSATPDWRVLLFSFALSVIASVLFSLAPIVQFFRPSVIPALKQQTVTAGGGHSRFRRLTVGVQIALSLLLLVGAGLFTRTLRNLRATDVGFSTDHLLTFLIDPRLAGYDPKQVGPLYQRLLLSLASQPGVESVSLTDDPDLAQSDSSYTVDVPGFQAREGERIRVEWERVSPGYFANLRMPLLTGRALSQQDAPGAPRAAVVNQTFARKFFDDPERVLGKTFSERGRQSDNPLQIVGVVKDAKHFDLHEESKPIFYTSIFQQAEPAAVQVQVRTRQNPQDAAGSIRRAVLEIDSRLVLDSLQTMDDQIDGTLAAERMLSFLATAFGTVAIFITAIGLYGVLAYSMAQRTREIGIRMALGATRASVVVMVLREVFLLAGTSIALSVPLSLALARLVKSQLFGVSDRDPVTLIAVTSTIAAVALLASWAPARRATQVDPMTALRYE